MIFLPVQCKMARAALGLGVRELAVAAKVSVDTVVRFERGDTLKERTIDALQRVLEAEGVEFTNGDRPGVCLTTRAAQRSVEAENKSAVAQPTKIQAQATEVKSATRRRRTRQR
jgi:transcriptional regulator with XRE-family HTH domain